MMTAIRRNALRMWLIGFIGLTLIWILSLWHYQAEQSALLERDWIGLSTIPRVNQPPYLAILDKLMIWDAALLAYLAALPLVWLFAVRPSIRPIRVVQVAWTLGLFVFIPTCNFAHRAAVYELIGDGSRAVVQLDDDYPHGYWTVALIGYVLFVLPIAAVVVEHKE